MTQHRLSLTPETRALLATADELLAGRRGYVVGGLIRDALLGRHADNIDLAVEGDAGAFTRALADRLGGHFVALDPDHGVSRALPPAGPVRTVDVSALAGETEADLALRDYTINAIAAPVSALASGDGVDLIDPHGGLDDLERASLRLISEDALERDPLRMLRGVRLAAQLGFTLTPKTADAIKRHAPRIGEASPERRRDELMRCFATARAAPALRSLDELGLLGRLLQEVTAGRGVTQPKEHYYDVLDHAFETVAALDFMLAAGEPAGDREVAFRRALWDALGFADLRGYLDAEVAESHTRSALLKLAGLLHDVAKPETRAPDETGRIRFFGHAERGAEVARAVLRRFRLSSRETEFVATVVEEHLRPGQLSNEGPPSRRALYRFYRDTGDAAEGVLLLSLADALAARGPRLDLDAWRRHVAYIAHVLSRRDEEAAIFRPPRLLSGDDIMAALEIGPGPEVGRLLDALEEAVAGGDVAGRPQALTFIRREHRGGAARREPTAGQRAPEAAGARS